MMKTVETLTVFIFVLALVYCDLNCREYCKENPCQNPISSTSCVSPTVYREHHAGLCACCPACVTLLPFRAPCKNYNKKTGETPSETCSYFLKCFQGTCHAAVIFG